MNIDYLKTKFPKYRLTDASNRSVQQIIRICSICNANKNIIVFLERNANNEEYFESFETECNREVGSSAYMLITYKTFLVNRTLLVNKMTNYDNYILHLQRILNNENTCPICFDEVVDYYYCDQCANICCLGCMATLKKKICSMCRYDTFTLFHTYE